MACRNSVSVISSEAGLRFSKRALLRRTQKLSNDRALPEPWAAQFDGKSILITGAASSFGRLLIEALLNRAKVRRVVIYSRNEYRQYEIREELAAKRQDVPEDCPSLDERVRFFIGDVRDGERLDAAMRGIDLVVHSAALRHPATVEYNPFECVRTNIEGAENVVQAAIKNKATRVFAISTDKAASPNDLYGASMLASDKIFVAANNLSGSAATRFAVMRSCTPADSRAGIMSSLNQRVVTVADDARGVHGQSTRFWVTLQQSVDFAISCLAMMRGGEIFVPKTPSVRLADLALAIDPDGRARFDRDRLGERLHDLLVTEDDSRQTLELPDRYIVEPNFTFWSRESYFGSGAGRVPDGFSYASDTNTEWLGLAQLQGIVETTKSVSP
jgi:UDP-N-acetylglucosamine 4,6-dehydratase